MWGIASIFPIVDKQNYSWRVVMLLPIILARPTIELRRLHSFSATASLLLQSGETMGYLKQSWSEGEVLALPDGEHNFFDRKSGLLWQDKGQLCATLSKGLSALSNSGGGHLIIGQANNGTFDGVPEKEGRTPVREWLEQKLPTLLSYPLEAFRVHTVIPDTPSQIPVGKAVIVVDVGDSRLAPHQACFPSDAPHYYYRQGGKSVLAPHHYLEALRNRLTYAVLEPRLVSVYVDQCYGNLSGVPVVELRCVVKVTNISRVPCYKWAVTLLPTA